jgi:hypothetical protein
MEVLLTVRVVEHLAGTGKKRRDLFPHPRSPLADHTQSDGIFWNQPRLFDLRESGAKLRFVLDLMPAQPMDHALVIDQRKPEALGIAPLAMP